MRAVMASAIAFFGFPRSSLGGVIVVPVLFLQHGYTYLLLSSFGRGLRKMSRGVLLFLGVLVVFFMYFIRARACRRPPRRYAVL